MWYFVLICDLLIPIIMVIGGIMMKKKHPKKINYFFGYRTERSMKNADTWNFAHDYCGDLWRKMGAILLFVSALAHVPFYNSDDDTLGAVSIAFMVIQCILLIASIFFVELALKKNFNDDGTKK